MYTDDIVGLGGPITFRTVFQKAKTLVSKAAPVVAQVLPPKQEALPATPVTGTLPPAEPQEAPERPAWVLPAVGVVSAFFLYKILGRKK